MNLPFFPRLKGDITIWFIFFALLIISLVEVFSAISMLSYGSGTFWAPFIRQAMFLSVGAIICVAVSYIPSTLFKFVSAGWPIIVLVLLITALSGGEVNGASRWLNIMGMSFQPSEFAKGILIATIALVLARCREGGGVNRFAIRYVAIFTLPVALLIFKDNISTGLFLCLVIYMMMFVAGVPAKQMAGLTLGVMILGAVGYTSLRAFPDQDDSFYKTSVGGMFKRVPTAKERVFGKSLVITADPDSLVVTDKNMQVVHARIAASNNNHGIGLMPGNSVERDYLPQAYSDFIFAIIIEETGLWGSGIVLLLYLVLLFRIGIIANKCGQNFSAFLVMGLGILLVGQALLNMAVATGLGPVTGQTLPLISRGGTSTLITCVYFGMIQSVAWSGLKKVEGVSSQEDNVIELQQEEEITIESADEVVNDSTQDE